MMNNKLFAGALFVASAVFAAKAVKDIRELKREEEELLKMADEVFEDELQRKEKN